MSASAQTNWVVWLSSSPTLLTTASSRELTKAAMQNKSRFTLKLQTSSISRLTGDRNIVVDLEQMIILDASAAVDSPFYDAASSPPLAPLKTRPCDAVENAIELTRREAQARGIFHIRGVLFDERVLRSVPRCWSAMTPRSGPMLFDEPENEATFQYVRAAMCLRGNRFEVTRVQRVQHLPLWSRYESARKEICERDDDNPFASSASGGRAAQARGNERWLFHGTRDTTPRQITHDGDGGFDMRLSNGLYYGKGLYFTESPKVRSLDRLLFAYTNTHNVHAIPSSLPLRSSTRITTGTICGAPTATTAPATTTTTPASLPRVGEHHQYLFTKCFWPPFFAANRKILRSEENRA